MRKEYLFIQSIDDLVESLLKFQNDPSSWRQILGNNPIYFVHFFNEEKRFFGLSKFCALKSISVNDYLSGYRSETNGTITKNHIAAILDKPWTPRSEMDKEIIKSFDLWIISFFPNYKLEKAMIMDISQKKYLNTC